MFIRTNTRLVESPSNLFYFQALSQVPRRRGREGMDERWALCPSSSIDKTALFVRLFGSNSINAAELSYFANSGERKSKAVQEENILKAGQFFTAADFVYQGEADVKEIFDAEILNGAYNLPVDKKVVKENLMTADRRERIVKKS